jgi:peptidoglycan-associated lipoprotein
MSTRPGPRCHRGGTILAVALLATLFACAPVTRGLKANLAAGSYERVILDGRLWLEENAAAAGKERAQLAAEVARLVAEAELGRARRTDQPQALRAFRTRYDGKPAYADLVAGARAALAEVVFRREVAASPSIERLRAFRAEFPGTPEDDKARLLEVTLAEGAAREAATVEAERAFRAAYGGWPEGTEASARSRGRELTLAERSVGATAAAERAFRTTYSDWQGAGPSMARSRVREVSLARAAADGDERRLAAFQAEYRAWPEATSALASARAAEAELALRAAGDEVGPLRALAGRFPEPPWSGRIEAAIAAAIVGPLRAELSSGQRPSAGTVEALYAPALPLAVIRTAAADLEPGLWAVAERTDDAGAWSLHGRLFPDSPRAQKARERAAAAGWRETERSDTAEDYLRYARRFPEAREATVAEGRATTLLRLARLPPDAPRAVITGRRTLPSGEVEVMLDVLRCGERVSGLRRDAFELYAGPARRPLTGFLALEEDRPVQFVFVVDLSGSMSTEREAVRAAILDFAETFRFRGRRAAFGLVTFSDEVRDRRPPSERPEEFRAWMAAVGEASGGAVENTVGGLEASSDLLAGTTGERVVVLLTDEPLQRSVGDVIPRARRSPACAPILGLRDAYLACGSARCRLGTLRGLDPRIAEIVDSCVAFLGVNVCARQIDVGVFNGALASCAAARDQYVGVDAPAFTRLRSRLGARGIRPFLILSDDVATNPPFVELAEPLSGRTFAVDDDSTEPATFTRPLLAIADQLSKQYVLRFRPEPGDPAEPRVLVRLHGDLSKWGESARAATLAAFSGSPSGCPELAALDLQGTLLRSVDCGRRFTRWRPGGLDTAQQVVGGPAGSLFLLSGGRVYRARSNGDAPRVETGLAVNERLLAGWDGTTWAVGRASDGTSAVARRAAGQDTFLPFQLHGLPPGPLALLPAGSGESACVLTGSGERLCGDGAGPAERLRVAGLPAGAPWTGGGDVVAIPGRAEGFLWSTSSGNVLRTLDGGGHFRETLPAAGGSWRVTVLPTEPPITCAASERSVRCSDDGGYSWFPVGTDLDAAAPTVALASTGGQLFVDRGERMERLAWVVNRDIPSSSVYFETGSDVPGPAILPFLRKLGGTLAAKPELSMRVEGHADRRGGDGVNDELARRRAARVAEAIVTAGARSEQVEIASFGSRRPLRNGSGQDDLTRNRRVELLLLEPMAVKADSEAACPAGAPPSDDALDGSSGSPQPPAYEERGEEPDSLPPAWAPEGQPDEEEEE